MEEVLSDLEVAIREKDAVIEAGPLPQAEVIPGQMRQVLQNLISNALKFSRKGEPPVIRISAEKVSYCSIEAPVAPDGRFVRLTIADNGIGFDNQYAEKIFTIFQRLHSKEKYEGTGIGLAITKKIMERHNGLIHAVSTEGKGTTFTLILPQQQAALHPPGE
jgi:two-component system CheB/CheR fusion protein